MNRVPPAEQPMGAIPLSMSLSCKTTLSKFAGHEPSPCTGTENSPPIPTICFSGVVVPASESAAGTLGPVVAAAWYVGETHGVCPNTGETLRPTNSAANNARMSLICIGALWTGCRNSRLGFAQAVSHADRVVARDRRSVDSLTPCASCKSTNGLGRKFRQLNFRLVPLGNGAGTRMPYAQMKPFVS